MLAETVSVISSAFVGPDGLTLTPMPLGSPVTANVTGPSDPRALERDRLLPRRAAPLERYHCLEVLWPNQLQYEVRRDGQQRILDVEIANPDHAALGMRAGDTDVRDPSRGDRDAVVKRAVLRNISSGRCERMSVIVVCPQRHWDRAGLAGVEGPEVDGQPVAGIGSCIRWPCRSDW